MCDITLKKDDALPFVYALPSSKDAFTIKFHAGHQICTHQIHFP